MPLETPQFDLPFRLDPLGAGPLEVEQDSGEEIGDSVEVLLRTPLGWYDDLPDYGVDLPLFEEGVPPDMGEIQTAITAWEERADALIDAQPDLLDAFVARVTVKVSTRD